MLPRDRAQRAYSPPSTAYVASAGSRSAVHLPTNLYGRASRPLVSSFAQASKTRGLRVRCHLCRSPTRVKHDPDSDEVCDFSESMCSACALLRGAWVTRCLRRRGPIGRKRRACRSICVQLRASGSLRNSGSAQIYKKITCGCRGSRTFPHYRLIFSHSTTTFAYRRHDYTGLNGP
jgi:hypothetical protein